MICLIKLILTYIDERHRFSLYKNQTKYQINLNKFEKQKKKNTLRVKKPSRPAKLKQNVSCINSSSKNVTN